MFLWHFEAFRQSVFQSKKYSRLQLKADALVHAARSVQLFETHHAAFNGRVLQAARIYLPPSYELLRYIIVIMNLAADCCPLLCADAKGPDYL
jgi:hypothetical protein